MGKYIKEKRNIESRVKWMFENKIQYFQPTICPAPKNYDENSIESVTEALKYFKPFTKKLVLQRKYMGSYCTLYLNRDHSKSYFVSRNGYVIKHIKGLKEASCKIHEEVFKDSPYDIEWILVEAEIIPWRALGGKLIDKEFGNYGYLHRSRRDYLENSEIVVKISKLKEEKLWDNPELKPHEKRQYTSIRDIEFPNTVEYSKDIELYDNQLEIFGKEDVLHFKPFSILKKVKYRGENILTATNDARLFCDDQIIISVDDKNSAIEFFEKNRTDQEEGIVVKPYEKNLVGIAPCLKVRTNEYLQLIYGVRFNRDFDYYMKKRRTSRKLYSSIRGYEIACQMLRTPISEIIPTNNKYEKLLYGAIDEENYLKQLDNRL